MQNNSDNVLIKKKLLALKKAAIYPSKRRLNKQMN